MGGNAGFRRRGGLGLLATVLVLGTVTGARNHTLHPPIPDSACRPSASASAADSASASEPVPTVTAWQPAGRAGMPAPDLDGDGHLDPLLDVPAGNGDVYETGRVALVRGSAQGPRPARRTVFTPKDFRLPEHDGMTGDVSGPTVADLDGDGHLDLVAGGSAHVQWGGPHGPDPRRRPAAIALPRIGKGHPNRIDKDNDAYQAPPVAGDFDGDGHTDLATYRTGLHKRRLVVLHGPFTRAGKPARTTERADPDPRGTDAVVGLELIAAEVTGDRAADLLVYEPGEPGAPLLLTGGARTATGLSAEPERLPAGESVAVGDFDGDGRPDIALGDSGVPTDEELEPADRKGRVTVRYGKAPGAPVVIEGGARKGGFGIGLIAGDLNGDGCDDLAVQQAGDRWGEEDSVDILRGGSSPGLGSRPWHHLTRVHRDPDPGAMDQKRSAGQPVGAADFDGDGREELVLATGYQKAHGRTWWLVDEQGRDAVSFDAAQLARPGASRE